jgi:hypothetical protein
MASSWLRPKLHSDNNIFGRLDPVNLEHVTTAVERMQIYKHKIERF